MYHSHCIQHGSIGVRLSCPILEEPNAHCALPVFAKLWHYQWGFKKPLFIRQSHSQVGVEECVEGVIVRVKPQEPTSTTDVASLPEETPAHGVVVATPLGLVSPTFKAGNPLGPPFVLVFCPSGLPLALGSPSVMSSLWLLVFTTGN